MPGKEPTVEQIEEARHALEKEGLTGNTGELGAAALDHAMRRDQEPREMPHNDFTKEP